MIVDLRDRVSGVPLLTKQYDDDAKAPVLDAAAAARRLGMKVYDLVAGPGHRGLDMAAALLREIEHDLYAALEGTPLDVVQQLHAELLAGTFNEVLSDTLKIDDYERPAVRWFLQIGPRDTPATCHACAIAVLWVEQWLYPFQRIGRTISQLEGIPPKPGWEDRVHAAIAEQERELAPDRAQASAALAAGDEPAAVAADIEDAAAMAAGDDDNKEGR